MPSPGERWSVPRRPLVEALDVAPAQVGEPQAPAGERDADLAGVQVSGEDEVERARPEPVDHARKMAEQDAQVGGRVGQLVWVREPRDVRPWVDARDLDSPAVQLDRPRVVLEQRRRPELQRARPPPERVARDPPGRGCRGPRSSEGSRSSSSRAAARPRGRETRSPLMSVRSGCRSTDPVDRALDRPFAPRGQSEMEVGQVRDPQTGQLFRQAAERNARARAAGPTPPRSGPRRGRAAAATAAQTAS